MESLQSLQSLQRPQCPLQIARALKLLAYQKEASHRYYERNREVIKARSTTYWEANRDTINERRRTRYSAKVVPLKQNNTPEMR